MLRQLRIALLFLPDSLFLGFLVVAGPFLLRGEGAGAAMATAVGYVTLPFAIAFLWAPFVDRHPIAWLGRRAGWAGLSQLLAATVLAAGAFWVASSAEAPASLSILLLCLAAGVLLATRNIALGAWMREGFDPAMMAQAVGARLAGASIGVWLGSGVLASNFPDFGWAGALAFISAALIATWPAVLALPGDERVAEIEATNDSLLDVARGMIRRPGLAAAVAMLFVLSAVMAPPFGLGLVLLSDKGFTAEEIAWSAGYGGSILCAVVALACGRLAFHFGMTAMIGVGVFLQVCLSLAWAALALGSEGSSLLGGALMVAQIGVYAMMSAMWMLATLRLVALNHAASEIALVSALLLLAGIVAPNVAGFVIDAYPGWARFFLGHAFATALAGIATIMVLPCAGLSPEPASV